MGDTADYFDVPPESLPELSLPYGDDDYFINRVAKEYERVNPPILPMDTIQDTRESMLRDQEMLQHSSLYGHQYMAGGAGEGKQRLKPNGSIKNVLEIKSDDVLPAYCNPPNPCPVGYSFEDGCTENFVNTATFSREYQSAQDCMCDAEHMFECPGVNKNDLNALAESIKNQGDIMDSTLDKILEEMHLEGEHKTSVAKKHHVKKDYNPYLTGDKLPVVAKKVPHLAEG
jgi:hypothetical protein